MYNKLKILVVKDLSIHKPVFASIIYDPIGYLDWSSVSVDSYVRKYLATWCDGCKVVGSVFDKLSTLPNEWTGRVCLVMDESEPKPPTYSIDVLEFEHESDAQPWRDRIYNEWNDQLDFAVTGVDPRVPTKAEWWNGFSQQFCAVIFAITLSIVVVVVGHILINGFTDNDD